jgi:Uma2 family endonuclease
MATKTTLTWEQFLAAGKADQRWEYIGGEIWFMPPGGFEQGRAIHKISAALGALDRQDWVCLGTDVAFTMAGGDWVCPDAAVVRAGRFGGRFDFRWAGAVSTRRGLRGAIAGRQGSAR